LTGWGVDKITMDKIISGGQQGADIGGLLAAEDLKIPTGGTAPKGYRTEGGQIASLRTRFGLKESWSGQYQVRTRTNVEDSDGTVIFTKSALLTGGSATTALACVELGKPVLLNPATVEDFRWWLAHHGIHVLNVAGTRESHAPGMEARVRKFLVEALAVTR
jgi:hypothetical protein